MTPVIRPSCMTAMRSLSPNISSMSLEIIIIATPLAAIVQTLTALEPHARGAVLLDVASVRAPVEDHVKRTPSGPPIVGLHPMAGRTAQGFAAADPALFAGRPFLVVPTQRADVRAMAVAGEIARAAGGVVTVCSAAEHDRIVALVSALPLALAASLSAAAAEGVHDLGTFAGPGTGRPCTCAKIIRTGVDDLWMSWSGIRLPDRSKITNGGQGASRRLGHLAQTARLGLASPR